MRCLEYRLPKRSSIFPMNGETNAPMIPPIAYMPWRSQARSAEKHGPGKQGAVGVGVECAWCAHPDAAGGEVQLRVLQHERHDEGEERGGADLGLQKPSMVSTK